MKALRIAIVGFGSAGAASAILLARDGHLVSLFERAPESSPIGAGFLLQPTGLSVLKELGIDNQVLATMAGLKTGPLSMIPPELVK